MTTSKSSTTPSGERSEDLVAIADHDEWMGLKEAAADIGCGVRFLRDGALHGGFPHLGTKGMQFSREHRDFIRSLLEVQADPAKAMAWVRARRTPRKRTQTRNQSAA